MSLIGSLKNPVLPGMSGAEETFFNFSGTKFSVRLPPYSAKHGEKSPSKNNVNIYDRESYIDKSGLTGELPFNVVCSCEWGVHGFPIIQRHIGSIVATIGIARWNGAHSLFNCAFLEEQIINDLNLRCGPASKYRAGSVEAMKNWRIDEFGGVKWAGYETHHLEQDFGFKQYSIRWLTPISDEHVLYITFTCAEDHAKSDFYTRYLNFSEGIMSGVSIELSPDAAAALESVELSGDNQEYSKVKSSIVWIAPGGEVWSSRGGKPMPGAD